jgi:hypothetical protein
MHEHRTVGKVLMMATRTAPMGDTIADFFGPGCQRMK